MAVNDIRMCRWYIHCPTIMFCLADTSFNGYIRFFSHLVYLAPEWQLIVLQCSCLVLCNTLTTSGGGYQINVKKINILSLNSLYH